MTFVSLVACWINWGFGLVIGALFAKQIAKTVRGVDYRLLIASAYSGFVIWHGGLAGSIPLSLATKDHPFEKITGIIPTSDTIFTSYNMFIVLVILFTLPIFNRFMMPKPEDVVEVRPELIKYLNRLSDYLFVLARYVSKLNDETEEYWNPNDR